MPSSADTSTTDLPVAPELTKETAPSPAPSTSVPLPDSLSKETAPVPTIPSLPPGYAPSDYPDGGLKAWLSVFGGALAMFCTFGFVNCVGTFEAYYVQGPLKNYSSSTVSWIASTQVFFMTFLGIITGPIFDRYGPRWTLILGSLTYVLGLMLLSLSHSYYQIFLTQSVVASLGSAAVFNHTLAAVSTWFLRRRAFAIGLAAAGSSLGGVILPIMIEKLIPRIGFPWTIRAVAFMFLGMLSICCVTITSRLPPNRAKKFSFDVFQRILSRPLMIVTCAGMFMFFWGMFLPFTYALLQAESAGVSSTLLPYLIPILNACSIVGRIAPGIAADYLGRFNVMIFVIAISAILTLGLWIPGKSDGAIIAYMAVFGFASGGYISLIPACIAQISDIREIGVAVGVAFALQAFAALTGAPIAGAIVAKENGSYLGLQVFCGVVMTVGGLIFCVSRYMQVGAKLVVKV